MAVTVEDAPATVRLGEHTVPVYPQRWRYAVNKLGATVTSFVSSGQEITPENFAVFAGDKMYDVLCALIPNLPKRMPEWEFNGYVSAEAAARDEYDPEMGREPDFAQIVTAVETAWKVNRLDVLGGLKAIVDPTMLKAQINAVVAGMVTDLEDSPPTPDASPISPSTNGTSDSTRSTPLSPMSMVSTD